jgi:hypothetical protein
MYSTTLAVERVKAGTMTSSGLQTQSYMGNMKCGGAGVVGIEKEHL